MMTGSRQASGIGKVVAASRMLQVYVGFNELRFNEKQVLGICVG